MYGKCDGGYFECYSHRPAPVRADRIVVVEHDPALRKVLQRLFSAEGYEVEVVSGGVFPLDMLRSR